MGGRRVGAVDQMVRVFLEPEHLPPSPSSATAGSCGGIRPWLWRGGPADASRVKQRTVVRRGGVGAAHRPRVHLHALPVKQRTAGEEVEAEQRVGLGSISAPGGCSVGTSGLRIISLSHVQESAWPATGGAGLAPVLWLVYWSPSYVGVHVRCTSIFHLIYNFNVRTGLWGI
jgi:hypothetical protein